MEMNFCRRCGSKLTQVNGHVYTCGAGHTLFANTSPTVGIFFVTPDNQLLLSERGIEPHKGMLDAFGGFLDGEETAEAAIARELKEELGVEPSDYDEVNYLCSAIGHYPYGGEVIPVMSMLFWTRLASDKQLVPNDDVAAVHTLPLDGLDLSLLHDDDIRTGIKKLQKIILS